MNFNEIPYKLAARSMIVDGLRVAYVDTNPGEVLIHGGSGPGPVVLLHGVGATLDWYSDVVEVLAPARRVIAPDWVGFGKSDKPHIDDPVPFYVGLLGRLLDELGVERATLVGHSMGGTVAAHFAAAHPDRVERLVLAAPPGVRAVPRDRRAAVVEGWSRQALARLNEAGWREWYQKRVFHWSDRLEEVWRLQCELSKGVRFREWTSAVEAAVRSVLDHPIAERARQIAAPTLVVWGSEDRVVPFRHAEALAAAIPGARLAVLGECGHYPMLERPEAFAHEVAGFVAPGEGVGGRGAGTPARAVSDLKPRPGMAPEIGRLARLLADVRLQCARLASALSVEELAWKPSAGCDSAGAHLLRLGGAALWYYHEMLANEPVPADEAARYGVGGGLAGPPVAPRHSAGQLVAAAERAHEPLMRWLEGREDEQLDRVFTHRETGEAATLRWILWALAEDSLQRRGQIAVIRQMVLDRRADAGPA